MEEPKFLCSGCGACCKRISNNPDFQDYVDPKTGWCKHLQEDNSCEIYENRPDICDVAKGFSSSGFDNRINFYKMNNMYCNQFQIEDGMDKKYRIDIRDYDRD